MPDEYGNLKPISVPLIPWLQTFEPGDRVRITATQQLGTVVARNGQPDDPRYLVELHPGIEGFDPGELRPA